MHALINTHLSYIIRAVAELLAFHKSHGGEGTLMVTPVEDPSKFGVIVKKAGSTAVERFVEKPKTWVGDEINAGIYVLNPSMLDRIELRPMSIEREVFPPMARDGELHVMNLKVRKVAHHH